VVAVASFPPELFAFLRELREHNDRDWFRANRVRCEDAVLEPALRFVSDFAPRLGRISRHMVADPRPAGGSVFRIYRDVRFSRDKSPYKTHAAISFRHEEARFELRGESLERVPAGYEADHPLIEDLKREDFVAVAGLDGRAATSPGFLDEFAATAQASAPYLRFLCNALQLPF